MLRTYLPNTLLYAFGTATVVMVLASMSGYGFSRYRFRGHSLLMTAILVITGVPLLTNLLALYQMGVSLRGLPVPFYNDRLYIITCGPTVHPLHFSDRTSLTLMPVQPTAHPLHECRL
jgi:ABC-type maltose transport system permease subunit